MHTGQDLIDTLNGVSGSQRQGLRAGIVVERLAKGGDPRLVWAGVWASAGYMGDGARSSHTHNLGGMASAEPGKLFSQEDCNPTPGQCFP